MNPETPIPLETVKTTMNAYQELVNRAEHIARLIGRGSNCVQIGGGYRLDDPRATVTFECDSFDMEDRGGWGEQPERHTHIIPLHYLCMTDAEIVSIVSKEQV